MCVCARVYVCVSRFHPTVLILWSSPCRPHSLFLTMSSSLSHAQPPVVTILSSNLLLILQFSPSRPHPLDLTLSSSTPNSSVLPLPSFPHTPHCSPFCSHILVLTSLVFTLPSSYIHPHPPAFSSLAPHPCLPSSSLCLHSPVLTLPSSSFHQPVLSLSTSPACSHPHGFTFPPSPGILSSSPSLLQPPVLILWSSPSRLPNTLLTLQSSHSHPQLTIFVLSSSTSHSSVLPLPSFPHTPHSLLTLLFSHSRPHLTCLHPTILIYSSSSSGL
jgi:hypothetical protein